MRTTKLSLPMVIALASFACASPRQEWPGPGPQPPPAPIPSVVAPPMPQPAPTASESSSSSATSSDLAPVDSATPPTTPPAPAPTAKPRHQEAASFTARGASQALACDQAKRGADSAALNKCGAGHALDKSVGQCTCSGGTAVASCTVTVTVMCENK